MNLLIEAGGSVFNPYAQLSVQIDSATRDITKVFDDISGRVDKGKRVNTQQRIGAAIKRTIATARMAGFHHGALITKKTTPALYGRTVGKYAGRRGDKVDAWMQDTTRRHLKDTPDSDYILSRERAVAAAQNETSRAYYRGVRDAFKDTGYRKRWLTAEGDSCEDCLANEEEGLIDVDDAFDSGHRFPPAHLNCPCIVMVRK